MLKACWDCVAGNGGLRNGGEYEGSYGVQAVQLNGESTSLYPARQMDRDMLLIPKRLHVGDKVSVTCSTPFLDSFKVNLYAGFPNPDPNNVACQLEVNLPQTEDGTDSFILRIIENGQSEVINGPHQSEKATETLPENTFKLEFTFELYEEPEINIFVNGYLLHHFPLKHRIGDISFLSISEKLKVNELTFSFA